MLKQTFSSTSTLPSTLKLNSECCVIADRFQINSEGQQSYRKTHVVSQRSGQLNHTQSKVLQQQKRNDYVFYNHHTFLIRSYQQLFIYCFYILTIYMKKGSNYKRNKTDRIDRIVVHTEIFPNLVTAQEQQIKDLPSQSKIKRKNHVQRIDHSFFEQQQELEVSVQQLKKSNAQKMSILVGQLLAKNINVKNAFQVPLIHINETCAFAQTSNDNSWKRLSSTLQSNNKIYGYRVDATHNYTYRVLQSIARQQKREGQFESEILPSKREVHSTNAYLSGENIEDCYGRYLEKNYRNINILHIDTFFNVNPVLEKTKRIFDQNGLRALLLNNLDISLDLSLRLTLIHLTHQNMSNNQHLNPQEEQFSIGNYDGCVVFKKIQNICKVNNLIEEIDEQQLVKRQIGEIEELWSYFDGESSMKGRKKGNNGNESKRIVQQTNLLINQPDQNLIDADNQTPANIAQNAITSNLIQNINLDKLQSCPAPIQSEPYSASTLQQPISNIQQTMQQPTTPTINSSQNHSHQSSNIPQPTIPNNQNTLISAYIKINKVLSPIEVATPHNTQEQDKQQGNLVQKWKNPTIKTIKKIKRKQVKPIQKEINFMDKADGVTQKRKSQLLSIDKVKKKQFKKVLKHLRIQPYNETNCQINIKQKILNFKYKTILSNYQQPQSTNNQQQQPSLNNSSNNQSNQNQILQKAIQILKYRQSSIRQAKEIIQSYIDKSRNQQIQFEQLFKDCTNFQGFSPALCFLTILHLTNENGYQLVQKKGDYNFILEK